jgi:hypothetical protein
MQCSDSLIGIRLHPLNAKKYFSPLSIRLVPVRHNGRNMQFMLLIYHTEDAITEEERQACYVESIALTQELHAAGKFISASPLQPVATATTVRVREKKRMLTDGPFMETREILGGYFMIDVANLDEALEVAARIPAAKFDSIEVRPVVPLAGLPQTH